MIQTRSVPRIVLLFLCCLCIVTALSLPLFVNAAPKPGDSGCEGAGGFVPLECFQDSAKLRDAYQTQELGPFLQKVFVGAISLGAILAVLRLAYAGFVYMASDLWTDKQKARDIIKDTFLGLFLLIAIYIILWQINPEILSLKINTGSQPSAQPGQQSNYFGADVIYGD